MLTQHDLSNISRAAEARDALYQVRNRDSYNSVPNNPSPVSGARYRIPESNNKLPVVDSNGKLFMEPFLAKSTNIAIPDNVSSNSILEYRDTQTGEHYYGRVKTLNKRKDAIEVENISSKEAEETMIGNPQTKVYTIDKNDITPNKNSPIMSTLMSMIDPSENVVFKLITLLLIGNIFETDSITDVFMAVYIRIVGLAVAIIALIYGSSVLF